MNTAGAGCSMSRCRFRCSVSWARSSLSARPWSSERKFDWFGFSALAIALAATQFLLDRGESEGWFDSDLIITTGVIVALAFYLFIAHECDDQESVHRPGDPEGPQFYAGPTVHVFARRAGAVDERDHAAIPAERPRLSDPDRRAGDDAARAGFAIPGWYWRGS